MGLEAIHEFALMALGHGGAMEEPVIERGIGLIQQGLESAELGLVELMDEAFGKAAEHDVEFTGSAMPAAVERAFGAQVRGHCFGHRPT